MQKNVVEYATPALSVTMGALFGAATGEVLFVTVTNAAAGALLSTWLRVQRGKMKLRDVAFAAVSALVFGASVGPWIAKLVPESEYAVGAMCFVMAMLGTRACEKLADFELDVGAFLSSIIGAFKKKEE